MKRTSIVEKPSTALADTASILRPPLREVDVPSAGGYVDLLGEKDVLAPRFSHQLCRKKGFLAIYEPIWRPLTARLLFGQLTMGRRRERRTVLGMLGVCPGDRVLDVGCGPGNYTRLLAQASGDGLVVGVDAAEAMLESAARRARRQNLAFVRADACALPFAEAEFDIACSVGAVHMTSRPMAALQEMVRVLRPGGRIAVATTCARPGKPRSTRLDITTFGRDELTGAFSEWGLSNIDQLIVGRAQFVAARKEVG